MIRITYLDQTYTLVPDDDSFAPVRFKPTDITSWATVFSQGGVTIDVLVGGSKIPNFTARDAQPATLAVPNQKG